MKRHVSFLVFFVIIFVSGVDGQTDYYPTIVGAKWTFLQKDYPIMLPNNPAYTTHRNMNSHDCCTNGDLYPITGWGFLGKVNPLIGSNGNNIYDSCQAQNQLVYYKKQYAGGETLFIIQDGTVQTTRSVSLAGPITVPAGTFLNCYKITTKQLQLDNSSVTYLYEYVAPNIGLIKGDVYTNILIPGFEQEIYVLKTELVSHSIPVNNAGKSIKIGHYYHKETNGDDLLVKEISSQTETTDNYFSVCSEGSAVSVFNLEKDGSSNINMMDVSLEVDPDTASNGALVVLSQTAAELTVKYQHPDKLPDEDVLYDSIRMYISYQGTNIVCIPIRVYRPPVLLIQGLGSDKFTFSDMENALENSNEYMGGQVYAVDYYDSRYSSFGANQTVVKTKGIERVLSEMREEQQCAAGKVDIIGHSMGGILARFYIQDDQYEDDIHKLITLNTPHSGSQWGNFATELTELGCGAYGILFPIEDCLNGAIPDLRVDNWEITTHLNGFYFPNRDVPSHAIVTTEDDLISILLQGGFLSNFSGLRRVSRIQSPILIAGLLGNVLDNVIGLFNDEANDWVVPLSSQKGGLASAYTSLIHNQYHSSTKNTSVINRVKELLNTPPLNIEFSPYQFDPPTLVYNLRPDEEANDNFILGASFSNIELLSPGSGASFPVNANFSIIVQPNSPDIHRVAVICEYDDENVLFARQSANVNQFYVDTFFSTPGIKGIIAIGVDTINRVFYFDTISVNIHTGLPSISQIKIQPNSLFLLLNSSETIKVLATTAMGEMDMTNIAGLTYQFKTNNAIIQNNQVIGQSVGLDTLTAVYGNHTSNKVPIKIVNTPESPCQGFNATAVNTGPNQLCNGQQTILLASGGVSYLWSNGLTTADNMVSQPGLYEVTITNAQGCTDVAAILIEQGGAVPNANFTFTVNGTTATFTNTTPSFPNAEYLWDFGDGFTSTESNPVHVYVEGGIYAIVLEASNSCTSTTKTILVNTAPTAGFSAEPPVGCAALVVQYINESSSNATTYAWQFPGGIPSASNQANPVVTYINSGIYSATLTAFNVSGSTAFTQTNYITVQNVPVPGFTASANGLTVTLTNTSSNGSTYLWNFGDNQTSTLQNPVHSYVAGGTYTVTMTVANACGSTMATKTVTLSAPPDAWFTANPTSGCAPLTVQYINTSSNATTYNWQFPGGTPSASTVQNPVVVYNTAGSYSVILTASNAAGSNTFTLNNYINVSTVPSTSFGTNLNGNTVFFTNTTTGGTTFLWNFGDGNTGMGTSPSHTYANGGSYLVSLTATNLCGSSSITHPVVINQAPVPNFTTNVTSGCAPLTVQFTNTSSNATTYNWQFPGGNPSSSTNQNPVVTYNTPGSYGATLTASNASGNNNTLTLNNFITVAALPSAFFSSSANGNIVSFTNTTTGATAFLWEFGDGNSSTQTHPVHTYANSGTYIVSLTATNTCGNSIQIQTVVIIQVPVSDFASSTTGGCVPLEVQFYDQSTENPGFYQWQFPGGIPSVSNSANPVVTYLNPGVYDVTLIVSNVAGSATMTQYDLISVQPIPSATFTWSTAGNTATFNNSSQYSGSYVWDFGDGNNSTEPHPTHTYALPGFYEVRLNAVNACGQSEIVQIIEIMGVLPAAAFDCPEQTGCPPFSVQFNDLSTGNPDAWNWTFEGGIPAVSTDQNPTVLYYLSGMYAVELSVSNSLGINTASFQNYITILDISWSAWDYVVADSQGTVQFINQTQGGGAYLWDFGDGNTSTEINPVHLYAEPGLYMVQLTVLSECGASYLQKFVQVFIVNTSQPEWIDDLNIYPNPSAGSFTIEMKGLPRNNLEFCLLNSVSAQIFCESVSFESGYLSHSVNQLRQLPAGCYYLRVNDGERVFYVKVMVE